MHYLQFDKFDKQWNTKKCRGLYQGGVIVFTKKWSLVYGVQNGLLLPRVPNGVTQFTLVSHNLDVHVGKKNLKMSHAKKLKKK